MRNKRKTGIKWVSLILMSALLLLIQCFELRAENVPAEEENEMMTDQFMLDKASADTDHTHTFNLVTTLPSCTEQGSTLHYCIYCDFSYTDNIIPAVGHKSTATEVPATCISPGYMYYRCNVCGSIYMDNYTDMIPHSFRQEIVKATTKQDGSITTRCTYCGLSESVEQLPAADGVELSKETYIYSGKVRRPSVTVYGSNGDVISAENYDIKYSGNGKSIGKYSILITLKGNYSGSLRRTYTIRPKGTELFGIPTQNIMSGPVHIKK